MPLRTGTYPSPMMHFDDALRFAAELWAQSRRTGRPTADATALDIDVLLAAQALRIGGAPVIATTNQKHLSQFVSAFHWTDISPKLFGAI